MQKALEIARRENEEALRALEAEISKRRVTSLLLDALPSMDDDEKLDAIYDLWDTRRRSCVGWLELVESLAITFFPDACLEELGTTAFDALLNLGQEDPTSGEITLPKSALPTLLAMLPEVAPGLREKGGGNSKGGRGQGGQPAAEVTQLLGERLSLIILKLAASPPTSGPEHRQLLMLEPDAVEELGMAVRQRHVAGDPLMRDVFALLDRDGDGLVSFDELSLALWRLLPSHSMDDARVAAAEALLAFDEGGDAALDYGEAAALVQRICLLGNITFAAAAPTLITLLQAPPVPEAEAPADAGLSNGAGGAGLHVQATSLAAAYGQAEPQPGNSFDFGQGLANPPPPGTAPSPTVPVEGIHTGGPGGPGPVGQRVARTAHPELRAALSDRRAACVFLLWDRNRDGFVDVAELAGGLVRVQGSAQERMRRPLDLIASEAARFLLAYDRDGDLRLNPPEFAAFLDGWARAMGQGQGGWGAVADLVLALSLRALPEQDERILQRARPAVEQALQRLRKEGGAAGAAGGAGHHVVEGFAPNSGQPGPSTGGAGGAARRVSSAPGEGRSQAQAQESSALRHGAQSFSGGGVQKILVGAPPAGAGTGSEGRGSALHAAGGMARDEMGSGVEGNGGGLGRSVPGARPVIGQ